MGTEIDDIKRERDEWQHRAEEAEDALAEALRLISQAEGPLRDLIDRLIEAASPPWLPLDRKVELLELRAEIALTRSQDKHRKARARALAALEAELRHVWRRRV